MNDTWVYLIDSTTGQHDLLSGVYAITWNCPSGGACSDAGPAMSAQYSNVYLNHAMLDGASNELRTSSLTSRGTR